MLDAISDFWKPSRKDSGSETIDSDAIRPGSHIGFGFIPQAELSGKRISVEAVNTYIFEPDRMTSFVLGVEGDASISLIVANSGQEKYIALSRKIPFAERAKLFDNTELLACMGSEDHKRLTVKKEGNWSAWTAREYKREINGIKGKLVEGDYRNLTSIPSHADSKDFNYTLLVSSNNEYALEIEQYQDNKMEVYATVYRRLSDVGEITPPLLSQKTAPAASPAAAPSNKSKAQTASQLAALKPANDAQKDPGASQPTSQPNVVEMKPATPKLTDSAEETTAKFQPSAPIPAISSEASLEASTIKPEPKIISDDEDDNTPLDSFTPKKDAIPSLQEVTVSQANFYPASNDDTAPKAKTENPAPAVIAEKTEQNQAEATKQVERETPPPFQPLPIHHATLIQPTKEQDMANFSTNINGAPEQKAPELVQARAIKHNNPEVENDSVECELPAANRIIEEAIRNEMCMSDVVRRVIALPVARQESVNIPVMLTDSDYSLLAIRYGIPAADRTAIKARIMEEINDFSGSAR